jgi:(2Fe-2S) ferredoxin
VLVYPDGVLYSNVTPEKVATIFDEHLVGGTPVESLRAPAAAW